MNNELVKGSTVVSSDINSLVEIANFNTMDAICYELEKAIKLRRNFESILHLMGEDELEHFRVVNLSVGEIIDGLFCGDETAVSEAVENLKVLLH